MSDFNKQTIHDIDVSGKKVLLRVDYNVTYDEKGQIRDDTRIRATLPTLKYLLEQKAAVIVISHLGRPKGAYVNEFSLKPVAWTLARFLGKPVQFADDCRGLDVKAQANSLQPGEVLLLENLRFHGGEESNDPAFAQELASLADIYVNDAFGVSHRAHASTEGVTHYLPAVAGFLLEKELNSLALALDKPRHPFVALVGGAKVADKIGIIENLLDRVDRLLIGGGMAHTFLAAQGYNMQDSPVDTERLPWVRDLLQRPQAARLVLSADLVVAKAFAADAEYKTVAVDAVPEGWQAVDIGPQTVKLFGESIERAATIVWNGPLGVFEMEPFAVGTVAVAEKVAHSSAFSIVGGGDSIAAIHKAGVSAKISHISTGGGAMLKFLEGKKLPGVTALLDR